MISFGKQTTEKDEVIIEATAARMREKGFAGDVIVYRNSVDNALATIAIAAQALADPAHGGDIVRAVGEQGRFTVIATREHSEGQEIRARVRRLRDAIGPEFGITPDEPKAGAKKPGFNV